MIPKKNHNPDRLLKVPGAEYFDLAVKKLAVKNNNSCRAGSPKEITFVYFENGLFYDPSTDAFREHGAFVFTNSSRIADKYLLEYFGGLMQRRKYILFYEEVERDIFNPNANRPP